MSRVYTREEGYFSTQKTKLHPGCQTVTTFHNNQKMCPHYVSRETTEVCRLRSCAFTISWVKPRHTGSTDLVTQTCILLLISVTADTCLSSAKRLETACTTANRWAGVPRWFKWLRWWQLRKARRTCWAVAVSGEGGRGTLLVAATIQWYTRAWPDNSLCGG